jgi:hypothetical protein
MAPGAHDEQIEMPGHAQQGVCGVVGEDVPLQAEAVTLFVGRRGDGGFELSTLVLSGPLCATRRRIRADCGFDRAKHAERCACDPGEGGANPQRSIALGGRHEGDADRREARRRVVTVGNNHDWTAASVDHSLGRGSGSDATDSSASSRADDDEIGVLFLDYQLQLARDVCRRGAVHKTQAHLANAALTGEVVAQAGQLG